ASSSSTSPARATAAWSPWKPSGRISAASRCALIRARCSSPRRTTRPWAWAGCPTEMGADPRAAAPRAPLAGVRILAVSQFGAGPFGTQVLADLGAEIIKIEDPGVGGDISRYVPPYQQERDSLYFQSFNRGKKSLALNLRHPEGQAVLRDLAKVSDAVFNNLRGDLPGKLGLTHEALKAVNPRLVCCSLTGFGTTGP